MKKALSSRITQYLLLATGFALVGVWIFWQFPWSLPLGFPLIMLATVVAGIRDEETKKRTPIRKQTP